MLGKPSIAGAVAAILIIPTALSAQGVGGAVNAGAAVRGAVIRGIPTPADHSTNSKRSKSRGDNRGAARFAPSRLMMRYVSTDFV
jgi:hypothetical protein